MLLSWPKLKAPADMAKQKAQSNLVPSKDTDEKSPLLINAEDQDIEAWEGMLKLDSTYAQMLMFQQAQGLDMAEFTHILHLLNSE